MRGGEVEKQALVARQMVENRELKGGLAQKVWNIARIEAREREKARLPLLLAGKKGEGEQSEVGGGRRRRPPARITRIALDFH